MDKRLITVIMAAVLMALLITAIFYQVIVGREPMQANVPTKELVIAKADLPLGAAENDAYFRPRYIQVSRDQYLDRNCVLPHVEYRDQPVALHPPAAPATPRIYKPA